MKADLIVQIVRYGVSVNGGTTCGVAWLANDSLFSPYLADFAFSVSALESRSGQACSDAVVAHEMGHNFGLDHDSATSPSTQTYYPYARGYKNYAFGTVMSYTTNRINRLSNPDINYSGSPTGAPIGTYGEAHAAQAVRNVMSDFEAIYDNVEPVYHTVNTSIGANGSISPSSASVLQGSATSFIITPSTNYAIASASGCQGSLSGNIYTTGAITGACTVTVQFERYRWAQASANSTVTFGGLPTGYSFKCVGTVSNLSGSSPQSNTVWFSTQAPTVPAAPRITRTDYGDGEIYLYVSAGADGGLGITSFTAACTDGTNTFIGTSNTSPITVSSLTNDVEYSCSVVATNALGDSAASAPSPPITPEFIPVGLPIWLLHEASK